jgi:hypothetical protein
MLPVSGGLRKLQGKNLNSQARKSSSLGRLLIFRNFAPTRQVGGSSQPTPTPPGNPKVLDLNSSESVKELVLGKIFFRRSNQKLRASPSSSKFP